MEIIMKKLHGAMVLKYILIYVFFIISVLVYTHLKYGTFMQVDYDSLLIATAVYIVGIFANEKRK